MLVAPYRYLGVAGNAIGPFGAQALLLAMGVEGPRGANGSGGDTGTGSEEQQAREERVGGGPRVSKSTISRSSSSSSTRDNIGGPGGRPRVSKSIISRGSSSTRSCTRDSIRGQGGGGAWLTIDMKGCCLVRKVVDGDAIDRAASASAFDPIGPNGSYT